MEPTTKKTYAPPHLSVYGQVEDLTGLWGDPCDYLGDNFGCDEGKSIAWTGDDRGYFQEYEHGYSG